MAEGRVEGFDRSLAYIVGIDHYTNAVPELHTPVADARALAARLTDDHGFESRLLLDAQGTLDGLKSFLEAMVKDVTAGDRVIFYFAGHGVALPNDDGPSGYLLAQDADRVSDRRYLPMTDLSKTLNRLPCRHVLVILDCCFAGAFRWSSTRDLIRAPELIHQERYRWFIRDPAWQAIASAAQDEKALDIASGNVLGVRDTSEIHSPFAQALLDGLAGAADRATANGHGDGVITATELFLFIEERFIDPDGSRTSRQTPLLWPLQKHDKGQFVFLVPGQTLELPPAPVLNADANPWRGLEPYQSAHASLFFGRSQVSRTLRQQFDRSRLTVVTGPSGVGKSSLVRAGLLPLLQGILPITMKPGAEPLAALAAALNATPTVEAGAALLDPPPNFVDSWLEAHDHGENIVLVVDQLEELYTMSSDVRPGEEFLNVLARCLSDTRCRLHVVCTVRAEFEPRFAQSALGTYWRGARFVVPQMTQDELRRVIEGPAGIRVLRFEAEELVDRLVNEVVQMPGALPLLSFALTEMFRHYLDRGGGDRTLTFKDYDSLNGGVVGALQVSANRLVESLTQAQCASARRVLERLVSIEAGEYARRRVPRGELVTLDAAEDTRVEEVLQRFDRARLIISDESEGAGQFELAHDALTLGWQTLVAWVRADARRISDLRRVTIDAQLWSSKGKRDAGLLWSDDARRVALDPLMTEPFPGLNAIEREFALASTQRARRNKQLRWAITITLVSLTLGALIAAGLAWDRTQTAVSRQIAAQSTLAARENALSTSMLLAVGAVNKRETDEAKAALLQSLNTASHVQHIIRFGSSKPNVVSMIGANTVAVGLRDGRVELFQFDSGERISAASASEHSGVVGLATAGGTVFALHKGGVLRSIDASNGSVRESFNVPDTLAAHLRNILDTDEVSMVTSPNGDVLAIGGQSLHLFDIAKRTWSVFPADVSSKGSITRVRFNPKSPSYVATAWSDGRVEVLKLDDQRRVFGPFRDHPSGYIVQTFVPATGASKTETRTDSPVRGLDVSPDGNTLATGGNDNRVVLRSMITGEVLGEPFVAKGNVLALAFDKVGLAVLSGDTQWYDIQGRRVLGSQLNSIPSRRLSVTLDARRAAFLSDVELALWDWDRRTTATVVPRRLVRDLPPAAPNIQISMLRDAAWLRDETRTLVTTSVDAPLAVWRLDDLQKSFTVRAIGGIATDPASLVAAHSREVALASSRGLEFWSIPRDGPPAAEGDPIRTPGPLLDMEFSEDGTEIIAANPSGIHVFSRKASTWTSPAIEDFRGAERSVVSRFGAFAAFSTPAEVLVVDRTGRLVLRTPLVNQPLAPAIALSADGQILAMDFRTYVDVWKVGDKHSLRRLQTGGADWIERDVDISPDGDIISVPDSGLYGRGLWSVRTGALQYQLRNVDGCCASRWKFDPSGKTLAEIAPAGITAWDLSSARWKEAACAIVGRPLTDVERTRYIGGIEVTTCAESSTSVAP